MSRWNDAFEKHEYRANWARLKTQLQAAVVSDQTVATSVQELARLKKAVAFIDGLLDSLDPELVPLTSTLDSFNSQASACADQIAAFNNNQNIGHIQNANNNADNLLTYVRPYLVADGKAGKALQRAAAAYGDTFSEGSKRYSEQIDQLLLAAKSNVSEIESNNESAKEMREAIRSAYEEFLGTDSEEGAYPKIKDRMDEFDERKGQFDSYFEELFVGIDGGESKKVSLESAVQHAVAQSRRAQSAVDSAGSAIAKIAAFERRILGPDPGEEDSEEESLSVALDKQKARLDEFELDQRKRTKALNEQIESLLPGATSAGLASAYREMKESFDRPISAASIIFYVSIGVLIVGSVALCIDKISFAGVEWARLSDWQSVLRSLAYKLPFYGPAVWLAYYASKRRSEFQRLQQEYAHKEALAKSYDSYKKQIEELGLSGSPMMAALLEKAIDAIASNASKTLDGKHGDKMPLQEVVEAVMEKLAKKNIP